MLKIDEESYFYLDLDKIKEFILDDTELVKKITEDNKNVVNNNLTTCDVETVFDSTGVVVQTNVKSKEILNRFTDIKYDIIRGLMASVLEPLSESDVNGINLIKKTNDSGVGFKIAFNTLQEFGMLKDKL